MWPHGVDNYCCGGGSGFAIMSGNNFTDWRAQVSGRKKLEQILNAFQDCPGPRHRSTSAPLQQLQGPDPGPAQLLRDVGQAPDPLRGLAELIVNAMVDVKPGFIEWEWH